MLNQFKKTLAKADHSVHYCNSQDQGCAEAATLHFLCLLYSAFYMQGLVSIVLANNTKVPLLPSDPFLIRWHPQ